MRVSLDPTLWKSYGAGGQNFVQGDPLGAGRPAVVVRSQGAGNAVLQQVDGTLVTVTLAVGQEIKGEWLGTDPASAVALLAGY